MSEAHIEEPWIVLKNLIEIGDVSAIQSLLEPMAPSDGARAVSRLDHELVERLLTMLPAEQAADLIQDLPDEQAADLIEELPAQTAGQIMESLPRNDQVDILSDFTSQEAAHDVIQAMDPEEARKTRSFLKYDEDTAGGIMTTEFLFYGEPTTVGDVLNDLEKNSEKYTNFDVQYIYVVNALQQLTGVLRMRDLLLSPRSKSVGDLSQPDPIRIDVHLSLEDVVDVFEDCGFMGLPVVDPNGMLLGIARRYEVMEAVGERETENYLKASGIVGGEELRSMPMIDRAKKRLSWLSVNIILNVIAASVIAFYQDTLSAVIALAVFLPIISDMSGCSGNQAVAVSIRELTMGITKPGDIFGVLLKECGVGLINGTVLGLLLGLVAFLWKGNFYLGLVVGGALAINTIVAVSIGGMVPLLLHKFKKDPALASGPILTTVTDMFGFFFALGFATLLLPLL